MLFVLVLTMARIVHADITETTPPVSIILDRFTLESWNKQSIWNKTRTSIVHHLNKLCKNDMNCNAQYGIGNVHLLNAINCGSSSVCLNVTVDKPVLDKIGNRSLYNYTVLLKDALLQAKIDVEQVHGNQLVFSSTQSNKNPPINRATRFLLVLLGISIVAIVFAMTIFIFQLIRQIHYSQLTKTTSTDQRTQSAQLNNPPSFSVRH